MSEYMSICLTHPSHGYYTTKENIFGQRGDFVTAPHVSHVFSELLAVWIANFLQTNNAKTFNLAELGPGDGLMMSVILRNLSRFGITPHTVHFLEASEKLKLQQKQTITAALPRYDNLSWHHSLSSLLDATQHPTVFILQEFLDALPVHILHLKDDKNPASPESWREQLVDVSSDTNSDDYSLRYVLSPKATPICSIVPTLPKESLSTPLEVSPQAISTVQRLSRHIDTHSGCALIIDYGSSSITSPTLRALSAHSMADVLSQPGLHDLTADVNFAHLQHAVESEKGVKWHGTVGQGELLLRLGAAERFRRLGREIVDKGGDDDDVDKKLHRLQSDYDRLITDMGEIYKVAVVAEREHEVYGL